jgi:hypothetical protein
MRRCVAHYCLIGSALCLSFAAGTGDTIVGETACKIMALTAGFIMGGCAWYDITKFTENE